MAEQTALLAQLEPLLAPMLIGVIAALHSLACILSLLLARYWQSELYNPQASARSSDSYVCRWRSACQRCYCCWRQVRYQLLGGYLACSYRLNGISSRGFAAFCGEAQTGGHTMAGVVLCNLGFWPLHLLLLIFVAVLDSALHLRSRLKDTA